MKTIIDISHHQKDFPWDLVKDEIDFVIVRPSHGMNDTDKEWLDNLAWLKANPNEKFAVYHYFYYQEKAKHDAEVQNFLRHIQPLLKLRNFTKLAFLDFEHPSDIGNLHPIADCSPMALTGYLIADCKLLISKGFIPGLYASRDWLQSKMYPNLFPAECVIWLAHYTEEAGKTNYPYRYDIHQYSSTGRLEKSDAYAGKLDMDYINPKTKFKVLLDIMFHKEESAMPLGQSSSEIRDAQQILKDRDYTITVDGIFGPQTVRVLKAFQKDNDIPITGELDAATYEALHSIREFSLARDGDKLVRPDCPNFYVREFACKDGSDKVLICLTTVKRAQAERNRRQRVMHIISGYRTDAYNQSPKVRGKKNSLHTKGYAIDFYFDGIKPSAIFLGLTLTFPGGLGKYATFTHMDSGRRRRWFG